MVVRVTATKAAVGIGLVALAASLAGKPSVRAVERFAGTPASALRFFLSGDASGGFFGGAFGQASPVPAAGFCDPGMPEIECEWRKKQWISKVARKLRYRHPLDE